MTTDFAKKLETLGSYEPGLPCSVGKLLESMEKEDREALEIVLKARALPRKISNKQVHEFLVSEGFEVAFSSVRNHRTEQCRCFIGTTSPLRTKYRNNK